MEIRELCHLVDTFVQDKGWYLNNSSKPQTAKNLAISLSIEAAELLEHFQWNEAAKQSDLADELADILIYAAQLANVAKVDIDEAIRRKLNSNQARSWDAAGKRS